VELAESGGEVDWCWREFEGRGWVGVLVDVRLVIRTISNHVITQYNTYIYIGKERTDFGHK